MAENGDMPHWAVGVAAAGTFVGGIIAVLFGRKKNEGPEDIMVLQRLARLEERADETDRREAERIQWRSVIFDRLLDLDKKTSTILAILDERRHER